MESRQNGAGVILDKHEAFEAEVAFRSYKGLQPDADIPELPARYVHNPLVLNEEQADAVARSFLHSATQLDAVIKHQTEAQKSARWDVDPIVANKARREQLALLGAKVIFYLAESKQIKERTRSV